MTNKQQKNGKESFARIFCSTLCCALCVYSLKSLKLFHTRQLQLAVEWCYAKKKGICITTQRILRDYLAGVSLISSKTAFCPRDEKLSRASLGGKLHLKHTKNSTFQRIVEFYGGPSQLKTFNSLEFRLVRV